MKTGALFTILALFVATSALAKNSDPANENDSILERVDSKKLRVQNTLRKVIAETDISLNFKVDLSILKNVGLGVGYGYNVEPSYQANLHTRIDRWKLRTPVEFAQSFVRIEPGAEVTFIRQFPTKRQAFLATPEFRPSKIPFSAESALSLSPGEVVIMPIHLNVLFGNGMSRSGLFARGHYVIGAKYQVQVARLEGTKVRLRMLAVRNEGVEAEAGVKLDIAIIGHKLASFFFGKGDKNLVMADYIFDLESEASRDAYDRFLSADQQIKRSYVMNPLLNAQDLQGKFISDLTRVDAIAREDKRLPVEQRRIIQIFRGRNEAELESSGPRINLLELIKFRSTTSFSRNSELVILDSQDRETKFLVPVHGRQRQMKVLFGLANENFHRRASLVVANNQDPEKGLGEYVVTVEFKDKSMNERELEKGLMYLKRNLAPEVVAGLGLELPDTRVHLKNARVFAQIIFKNECLKILEGLDRRRLETKLFAYLSANRADLPGDEEDPIEEWIDDRDRSLGKLVQNLSRALDPNRTRAQRIDDFMSLQRQKVFREIGTGFLMSLLPSNELERLVAVSVRFDASTFPGPIEKPFGKSENLSLLRVTEYMQHLLEDGSFDIRLENFGAVTATNGQILSYSDLNLALGLEP